MELLGNHLDRGVRVQVAMPDDLADRLLGPTRWPLGAAFAAAKAFGAALLEGMQQLKVPLLAVAVLAGGGRASQTQALPLDEHEQLPGHLVLRQHGQIAMGSHEFRVIRIPLKHTRLLP
jgi:hypothetical protein